MDFRELFPLLDLEGAYSFDKCFTLKDFLQKCVSVYFVTDPIDERIRESCLSVYLAFRDHYPDYMDYLDQEEREKLDFDVEHANPKVIKLRRIAIGAISKVA